MVDRNARFQSQQHRDGIRRQVHRSGAMDFFNMLTGPELLQVTEAHLPEHRERLYPPTVTLSMFLKQVLQTDSSCQRAVDEWAAQCAAEGLRVQSIRTGGYCQARQRLPLPMLIGLTQQSGRLLSGKAAAGWLWRNRVVKLADGTSFSMPDTPQNQARFPHPRSQRPGVGFPLARMVGVTCLATGVVLGAQIGPHTGAGNSELDLFRRLIDTFSAQDVALADALYCNYFLIAMLQARGVDVLFEQNGARITDFRRGQWLGKHDHVVSWPKPRARPAWMSRAQYAAFPQTLTVREVKVGTQVLVTTLLDAREVHKSELSALYARRWQVGVSS